MYDDVRHGLSPLLVSLADYYGFHVPNYFVYGQRIVQSDI